MLQATNVSAWFGSNKVLERVSLVMEPRKVTALIGPSGCGKSTFLRILNRMHELVPIAALSGSVMLDGVDIYGPASPPTFSRDSGCPARKCPTPTRWCVNASRGRGYGRRPATG
jgi:phosphate transport system ATP-binding protein